MIEPVRAGNTDISVDFCIQETTSTETSECRDEIRAGQLCPKCKKALIDYDGLLNLTCPECGLVESGSFT